jgi:hypothetical protein
LICFLLPGAEQHQQQQQQHSEWKTDAHTH